MYMIYSGRSNNCIILDSSSGHIQQILTDPTTEEDVYHCCLTAKSLTKFVCKTTSVIKIYYTLLRFFLAELSERIQFLHNILTKNMKN